jgi:hypothetical protein
VILGAPKDRRKPTPEAEAVARSGDAYRSAHRAAGDPLREHGVALSRRDVAEEVSLQGVQVPGLHILALSILNDRRRFFVGAETPAIARVARI